MTIDGFITAPTPNDTRENDHGDKSRYQCHIVKSRSPTHLVDFRAITWKAPTANTSTANPFQDEHNNLFSTVTKAAACYC